MVSGSAALPETIFNRWKSISGHFLLERYGMTETGMVLGNPYKGPRVPGEVGVPFPGVDVQLVDEHGKPVSSASLETNEDVSGRLLVKSKQLFSGYWNRPDATNESFTSDGWFITGDIAAKTLNETYKILGRESADIIKSRGYKISTLEIEREILNMSTVSEVTVFGVPDEEIGESLVAMVVPKLNQRTVMI